MKISILIPVYNEKATIEEIISQVVKVDLPHDRELIIVDDCSTDGTRDILKEISEKKRLGHIQTPMHIFYHDVNQGKGAGLRTAIQHASGDIAIIQDADLEYDPREYPRLLQPIVEGRADVVFGSRFLGGPHRVLFFWHYVANKFLTLLSNAFNNINLTDMETCYKVFRMKMLKDIHLTSNRFGFEPEITAKIAKQKCRIFEVPISYYGRDYSEGKKIGWKDGVAAIYFILKFRFCG